MDREIAPQVRRRKLVRRVTVAIAVAAALLLTGVAAVEWLRPSLSRREIQTARVQTGEVTSTLQASGTVVPAVEQVVSSPVEARVLRIVRRAGDRVRAGDELIALDTSASRLEAARLDDRVAQKESETAQLRLRLDDSLAALRATIEQKKLDADIYRFKAEQNAKLHAEGLVAKQENLAAAATLRKCEIELVQLREALARGMRSADAQLAASALELRTLRSERDEARRQLGLAMMHADRDGVVTSIVEEAGATVRRGDPIARIADLSKFRVAATISDMYASRLARGMRVRVRVDDATSIGGAISSIDPRIDGGTARFWIDLDEPSNAKLRNNLRVDVFVVTGARSGVLTVKRGVLGASDREEVFVVRGSQLVRTPVAWGLAGEDALEVRSGLAKNDEVVISNMNDYSNVKRIRLKEDR